MKTQSEGSTSAVLHSESTSLTIKHEEHLKLLSLLIEQGYQTQREQGWYSSVDCVLNYWALEASKSTSRTFSVSPQDPVGYSIFRDEDEGRRWSGLYRPHKSEETSNEEWGKNRNIAINVDEDENDEDEETENDEDEETENDEDEETEVEEDEEAEVEEDEEAEVEEDEEAEVEEEEEAKVEEAKVEEDDDFEYGIVDWDEKIEKGKEADDEQKHDLDDDENIATSSGSSSEVEVKEIEDDYWRYIDFTLLIWRTPKAQIPSFIRGLLWEVKPFPWNSLVELEANIRSSFNRALPQVIQQVQFVFFNQTTRFVFAVITVGTYCKFLKFDRKHTPELDPTNMSARGYTNPIIDTIPIYDLGIFEMVVEAEGGTKGLAYAQMRYSERFLREWKAFKDWAAKVSISGFV
ncbi:hypothetical protein GYMLUDRAFT_252122 [Collybiopsis luxurians FD-317 M1]|uniref:Uncharacterized protein n=1 Tax=Collybiopsis luxurians FD-317 M1 TaxID=944289 RepID=A0A0D0BAL6_9AGAR|nr:hypothetical protein GYMLUDRAFT_252122 [Collybiopsis luxurians FD-317 M1]